jgi:multidrug resistance efflux pump
MQKLNNIWQFVRRQPRWRLFAALVLVTGLGFLIQSATGKVTMKSPTFSARRGALEITVLEGGSLQALESQEIKCEVRVGYQGTKILKIVDEGYQVTDEDVKNGKVLVELDSSELQKQIVQQEIQYQSAVASLTDAQQNYEIQVSQNYTDIQTAEQKTRFARMDLDKFLGDTVTTQIVEETGLNRILAAATTNDVEQTSRAEQVSTKQPGAGTIGAAGRAGPIPPPAELQAAVLRKVEGQNAGGSVNITPAPKAQLGVASATGSSDSSEGAKKGVQTAEQGSGTPSTLRGNVVVGKLDEKPGAKKAPDAENSDEAHPEQPKRLNVDFSKYASIDALGDGEAKQKLRKFDDDLQVAQKELGQARTTLDGTKRLFEKGFVTKTDFQRDEIAFENSRLKVQTAETARDLFMKYDFLKSAEEALSKYSDAVHEFDKARRLAVSKLAQARAKLKSAQGQHEVQVRQKNDFNEQLEKCTIRAQKTGLVVYGGARDDQFYYGGEERIREGAAVRERQAIITIPDMRRMSVNVKIHESYIKKVKKGQKARITVDAFPDDVLTGEVSKMGVLPDSQNRWMNPDMKVYLTTITIDGTHDWVKPGMSSKVEIMVNRLDDCVYVPVQAVSPENGKQVCYVAHGLKPERREVQIGEFNDEFIEVRTGIKEGEQVLLRRPDSVEPLKPEPKPGGKEKESPTAPSVPSPAPVAAAKT